MWLEFLIEVGTLEVVKKVRLNDLTRIGLDLLVSWT